MEETGDRSFMVEESQLLAEVEESLCRLCGSYSSTVVKIFTEENLCSDLGSKINLYLPVEVKPGDGLPEQCCWSCTHIVVSWHDLYLTCKTTEEKLMVLQKVHSAKTVLEEPAIEIQHVVVKEEHYDLEDESMEQTGEEPQNNEPDEVEQDDEDAFLLMFEEEYQDDLINSDSEGLEENEQEQEVPCTFCGAVFERKSLKLHLLRDHPDEKPFSCEVCGKGFRRQSQLAYHLPIHSDLRPFKCQHCTKTFKTQCYLKYHQTVHSFVCKLCGKEFERRPPWLCHIRIKHKMLHQEYEALSPETVKLMKIAADFKDMYFCKICNKPFKNQRSLNAHVRWVHDNLTSRKGYRCQVCGVLTCNKKEHLASHSDERPFSCEVCGRGFKLRKCLTRHMVMHSDVKHGENSIIT